MVKMYYEWNEFETDKDRQDMIDLIWGREDEDDEDDDY